MVHLHGFIYSSRKREKGKGEENSKKRSAIQELVCLNLKKKIWESFQVTIYTNEKIDTSVLNHRVVEGRLLKAAVIWAYRQQMQRCGTSLQNNQVPKNQFSFTLSFR